MAKSYRLWILAAFILITGCGGGKNSGASSSAEAPPSVNYYESGDAGQISSHEEDGLSHGGPRSDAQSIRMVVITSDLRMSTDDFYPTMESIKNIVIEQEGYFASSNTITQEKSPRIFNATIKIPAEKYDAARKLIEEQGEILYSSESNEDVTASYTDIQSRLKTKKTEEERLLTMIGQAEEDVTVLLELESRLGEVRTQIAKYEGKIKNMNRLTAYSTIQLNLTEESDKQPIVSNDLSTRMENSFLTSNRLLINLLEGLVLLIVFLLPPIAIIAILAIVVLLIGRWHHLDKAKK